MSIVFTISETFRPGESSVADRVPELLDGLNLAIPYTTRRPRSAEDEGFVFTSQDVFERMIASEEFLEYVNTFGNYYGTRAVIFRKPEITAMTCSSKPMKVESRR
jgi:guanylate kinase